MNHNQALTSKIPLIGRKDELAYLRDCLHARGENHVVYFWAEGGYGKTRLLEELRSMVEAGGPAFAFSGIIDLYHTDTHSNSDVERAIVDGLDRAGKYFRTYREQREEFQLLRERGADPGVLEAHRRDLSAVFVREAREMAHDMRKLVICFDTMEVLQYESSVVEENAGLEEVDTRVRYWMLEELPKLANVLIVFAGRPKSGSVDQSGNHQERLAHDLGKAFGNRLRVWKLPNLDLEETRQFIHALFPEDAAKYFPEELLPSLHRLTGGRPVFIHLIADLLAKLAQEPRILLDVFQKNAHLVDAPDGDPRLSEAQRLIKSHILGTLFNQTGEMGVILSNIALIPKGVDPDILEAVGIPREDAERWLTAMEDLSIVKQFKAWPDVTPSGAADAERLDHTTRTFLHDEVYRLLNPSMILGLLIREKQTASTLIKEYYQKHIETLQKRIDAARDPQQRIGLRTQLHKYQVERLYYALVCNAGEGYHEYLRLSEEAIRNRWTGYSIRLLDEFLRFYNEPGTEEGDPPRRRARFADAGVTHDAVIRESVRLWMERFYWWGQHEKAVRFAAKIEAAPETFHIDPQRDVAFLANIYARWLDSAATLAGYDERLVNRANALIARLPRLEQCTPEEAVAVARLHYAIGFQYRTGGLLHPAGEHSGIAKAAFRSLNAYHDELAILLNSLAYVYAQQGRMELARPVADEALQINESMGSDYSRGLTYSTLAAVYGMIGDYSRAVEYGQEALSIFRDLEDAHGSCRAYQHITHARRRMARRQIERGWRLDSARMMLDTTIAELNSALTIAQEHGLQAREAEINAGLGRAYREYGRLLNATQGGLREATQAFNKSRAYLEEAIKSPSVDEVECANLLEDLAEVYALSGDDPQAARCLARAEETIGPDYQIALDRPLPKRERNEYFWPLGKVERLRGRMALERKDYPAGLEHFARAYAYFALFSPDSVQKEAMLGTIYDYLRGLPLAEQAGLLRHIQQWGQGWSAIPELGVGKFLDDLKELLGVPLT